MGIAQLWIYTHHGLTYHALKSLIGTQSHTLTLLWEQTLAESGHRNTHTNIHSHKDLFGNLLSRACLCPSPPGKRSLPLPLTARHQRFSLWVYTINNSFYTQYTQHVCTSKFTNFHSEHRMVIYCRTAMALFRYLAQMRSDLTLRRYGKVILLPQPLSIIQRCEPKL